LDRIRFGLAMVRIRESVNVRVKVRATSNVVLGLESVLDLVF
jgi:hypothetical protein